MWAVTEVDDVVPELFIRKPETNWSLVKTPAHLNLCNNPVVYLLPALQMRKLDIDGLSCR